MAKNNGLIVTRNYAKTKEEMNAPLQGFIGGVKNALPTPKNLARSAGLLGSALQNTPGINNPRVQEMIGGLTPGTISFVGGALDATRTGKSLLSGLFNKKQSQTGQTTGVLNDQPQQVIKQPIITSSGARKVTKENQSMINNSMNMINQGFPQQQYGVQTEGQQTTNNGQLQTSGTAKQTTDGATVTTESNYGNTDLGIADRQYLSTLDQMMARSDASSRALISQIKATYANRENKMNEIYQRQKAGAESAGLRSGSAQTTPVLFDQTISSLEKANQTKLTELDQQEIMALSKATQDMDNKNWKGLNEKANYVKQIRAEKAKALQDSLKLAWEQEKFMREMEYKQKIDSAKLGLERERIAIARGNMNIAAAKAAKAGTNSKITPIIKNGKVNKDLFKTRYTGTIPGTDGVPYMDKNGRISQEGMQYIVSDLQQNYDDGEILSILNSAYNNDLIKDNNLTKNRYDIFTDSEWGAITQKDKKKK